MKSPKKSFRSNHFKNDRSGAVAPPITFTPSTWYKKDDDEGVKSFKLRSTPTEKKSPVFDMQAKSFATGSVEQFILWKRDLYTILEGQDIKDAKNKFSMAERLLHGDALSVFEQSAANKDRNDEEEFDKCIKELANHVFPKNALALQKSWFRRSKCARKSNDILTRRWVARLQEINMMLEEFPPDYSKEQMLRPEDTMEVLEYGIPNKWKAEMIKAGFVPASHTSTEFVEFCERQESSEQMLGSNINKTANTQEQKGSMPKVTPEGTENNSGSHKLNAKTSKTRSNPQTRCRTFVESNGNDGCALHVNSTTHRSNACKVLLAQAESMRKQAAAKFDQYKNKGGKPKSNSGDIHALMAQVSTMNKKLAKALKNKTPQTNKKRKRDDSDSEQESAKNLNTDSFTLELEEAAFNGGDSDDDLSSIDWEEDRKLSNHKKMHYE